MKGTSGPQRSSASAWYDRDSSIWRTYQGSLPSVQNASTGYWFRRDGDGFWKRLRRCFLPTSDEYLETWPKAGMTCDGVLYPQPNWERRIAEIGSGSWPTPRSYSFDQSHRPGLTALDIRVRGLYPEKKRYWPTPQAHDVHKGDATRVGRYGTKHGARNLNDEVAKWPTPTSSMITSADMEQARYSGNSGKRPKYSEAKEGGGTLNPEFVEWLQAWPLGWTDSNPLEMDKYRQWLRQHGGC